MSYVVLARKWRPMRFEDVVRQDHRGRSLENALRQPPIGQAPGGDSVSATSDSAVVAP